MSDPDFIQYLKDKDAISKMVFQYATALDQRNWELLPPLYTDDVAFNYGSTVTGNNPAALVAMCRANLDGCGPSQHLFSNLRVSTQVANDGMDTASCDFYGRVMHAGTGEERHILFDFWGEYHFQLVRTSAEKYEGWRIAKAEQVPFHFTGDMCILKAN